MDALDQVYEYQAGGKTVSLRPDKRFVGVNLAGMDEAMLKSLHAAAKGEMQEIRGGMVLIPRTHLMSRLMTELRDKNAVFPVFSEEGTRMIALPEVRVEPPAGKAVKAGLQSLSKWIGERDQEVQVLTKNPNRMVVAPLSGYGPDAVTLAHDIAKKFKTLTASPRFMRIMPQPKMA
jgi:hypothetical protein